MISAERSCAKVTFAGKEDFYIGEGTDLGFSVCGSSAMVLIQFAFNNPEFCMCLQRLMGETHF